MAVWGALQIAVKRTKAKPHRGANYRYHSAAKINNTIELA